MEEGPGKVLSPEPWQDT